MTTKNSDTIEKTVTTKLSRADTLAIDRAIDGTDKFTANKRLKVLFADLETQFYSSPKGKQQATTRFGSAITANKISPLQYLALDIDENIPCALIARHFRMFAWEPSSYGASTTIASHTVYAFAQSGRIYFTDSELSLDASDELDQLVCRTIEELSEAQAFEDLRRAFKSGDFIVPKLPPNNYKPFSFKPDTSFEVEYDENFRSSYDRRISPEEFVISKDEQAKTDNLTKTLKKATK